MVTVHTQALHYAAKLWANKVEQSRIRHFAAGELPMPKGADPVPDSLL